MNLFKIAGVVGALVVLAGCASDIQKMRTVEAQDGTAFTKALTEQYQKITLFEADEMRDWQDAGYFARKGLAAAAGETVLPEELGNWDIGADFVDELTTARGRLMAALDAGARDAKPELAARAQGRFDCWVEQQEEGHQADHIAACKDEFLAAMEELEGAEMAAPMPSGPGQYLVLFDWDSDVVNDAGQAVINQVIADVQGRGGNVGITATGHADRSGSEEYNTGLSLRRADAVRTALIDGGIPAEAITTAGRGESEPAVPTDDGVREQANRRVEILLQ